MMPVKICGITNADDAQLAVQYGTSAIGFIFYDQSPRYITPENASQITIDIKEKVSFVGVFVDETLDYVHGVAKEVGLDFIQLHGNESPAYCQEIHFPVIKVFRVSSDFNAGIIKSYNVHAFLFDTYKKNKFGGTGEVLNWDKISNLQIDKPIILSGGLNIENIEGGVDIVCPSAVDVNSGVESRPGKKNEKKMVSLVKILNNTQSATNPFEIPVIQRDSYDI